MKQKTRNLIEIIIQGVMMVLLFIPGMYQEEYWKVDDKILGAWKHKWTIVVSHWTKNISFSNVTAILLWALIIVMCVAFVIYLIQYIGDKKANLKVDILFPVIELILFVISAFFTDTSKGEKGDYTSYFSFPPYIIFPIMIALMVALFILSLIGYLKRNKIDVSKNPSEKI